MSDGIDDDMIGFHLGDQLRFAISQAMAAGIRAVGAEEGSLLLASPTTRSLVFAIMANVNGALASVDTVPTLVGKTVPIGEGVTGMAALTRDVQSAVDSEGGARFHRVQGDGKPHAVLAAPVIDGDTLLGVLTAVSFNRRTTFTREHGRTYGMSANAIAGLLHYAVKSPHAMLGKVPAQSTCDLPDVAALLHDIREFSSRHPNRVGALRRIVEALGTIP